MTAEIHQFPSTDFEILTALRSNYVREATGEISSWHERCRFVNNLIKDNLDRLADRIAPDFRLTPEEIEFWDKLMLSIHLVISDVVMASGETEPSEDAAACLFAQSSDPVHRQAARGYALAKPMDLAASMWKFEGDGLGLLWNITAALRPGLGEFHRAIADHRKLLAF